MRWPRSPPAGFSPHPLSIGGYQNPAVEWIDHRVHVHRRRQLRAAVPGAGPPRLAHPGSDEELRAYAGVVAVATGLAGDRARRSARVAKRLVRTALFQVLSIITTTGFASTDFNLWSEQAKMVLLVLMFIGGCAGSASAGRRWCATCSWRRYTLQNLRRTLHPRAVLPVKLGGRVVPDRSCRSWWSSSSSTCWCSRSAPALVVLLGADIVTGITATIAMPRQHRARLQPGRADGASSATCTRSAGDPDAGDVDRPARSAHRAGRIAAGGLAIEPVVGRAATCRPRHGRRRAGRGVASLTPRASARVRPGQPAGAPSAGRGRTPRHRSRGTRRRSWRGESVQERRQARLHRGS